MPSSVNHLGEPEYAGGLHRRLLGLGTFGAQKAGLKCLIGLHRRDDCAYPQQSGYWRKPFIRSSIDIGDAIVRDSSDRPLSMSGRACPLGPEPLNLLRTSQKPRALLLQSTPFNVEPRRPYEFSHRSRKRSLCSTSSAYKKSGRCWLDDCHEEDRGFTRRVNFSIDCQLWKSINTLNARRKCYGRS
jgi:hypothetical protein